MNRITWAGIATGAAIAVAAITWTTNARAADLGGDCCQDLEARVAMLEAEAVHHGNRKVKLTISGTVDYALLNETNNFKANSGTAIVQNANDPTLIHLEAVGTASKDIYVGGVIEFGINPDSVNIFGKADNTVYARKTYVYVNAGMIRGSIGHLDQASKGLEAQTVVDVSMVAPMLDVTTLIQGIVPPAFSLNGELFGGSTLDAVRVDINPVAGLYLSASYAGNFSSTGSGGNGIRDVAIYYRTMIGKTVNVMANAGYRDDNNGNTFILASAGIHEDVSGLFVQGGYGQAKGTGSATFFGPGMGWNVQAGISKAIFGPGAGTTTVFGEYAQLKIDANGSPTPDLYGLGIVQQVGNTSTDVFAGWRKYETRDAASDAAQTILAGAVIHF